MAKKTSPPKGKKKGAGKKGVPVAAPQEVRIAAGDDGKQAYSKHYIIWTNTGPNPCPVDFNIDGCPLDQCSFAVPAGTADDPGTLATKVTVPGHKCYHYKSPCGSKPGGNPVVIVD